MGIAIASSVRRIAFALLSASFLAVVLASPGPALASLEHDGRFWVNLTGEGDISGPLRWYFEAQPRFRDEGGEYDQMIVRPAVQYKATGQTSLWGGYAYIHAARPLASDTSENRFWQQLMHKQELSGDSALAVTSRTRFEQRLFNTGDQVGHRLRQLVRVSPEIAEPSGVAPLVWNEVFLNLNDADWGARSGFDQNRVLVGVNWKLDAARRFEIGYLNQLVRTPADDLMNHVLSATFFVDFAKLGDTP